jgi:hypothetical protein
MLLWGDWQLCHMLLLEVPAAFLFLPLAFSAGQGLPIEDTLGIYVCFQWRSLQGLPNGRHVMWA